MCYIGVLNRLSKEHSRELQHVVVSNDSHKGTSAAAAAAVAGEAASKLAMGQPTAVPAPLSTEAAAAAAVGTGSGVTRRRGWFSRKTVGKGSVADGELAIAKDGEEKTKEEPVKVGRAAQGPQVQVARWPGPVYTCDVQYCMSEPVIWQVFAGRVIYVTVMWHLFAGHGIRHTVFETGTASWTGAQVRDSVRHAL